jgi:membrane protein DedA with SNARE-associated domain
LTVAHFGLAHFITFVERHGYALLFFWILAEQGAIPLPSIPLLVAAGVLVRLGKMHLALALICCVVAALIADTVWFHIGRKRGQGIFRLICRISLEPDSCVRRTENAFLKHGLKSLLVSKFVPGLNAIAAPLAGSSGASYWRFFAYDCAGAVIWSTAYIALGYTVSRQLEVAVANAAQTGANLLILIVALLAVWIAWKYCQRRRFLGQLRVARITPEELRQRIGDGEDLMIVDLRSGLDPHSATIPGAIRVSTDDLVAGLNSIPRDREIILFCS